ncbi:aldo/keto reductase [Bacillus sp. FJAT-26390]|uniref:aldo/keto reductase n=1 Tax=Bacillus sp. FJAT-26390 TaxID=1743142 RepID=UPI000807D0D2|nr:aldo/keto reductase [Bacillus sp. FJAT-26390]OBZ09488.1 aldo/keto reductase [Bacillus sp. FJAT-26390]
MKTIQIQASQNGQPIVKSCSQLIMGSTNFLRADDMDYIHEMFGAYLAAGGNTFDTAHQYDDCEQKIGRWLEETGKREQVNIMTKGAHPDDGEPGNRVNAKAINKDVLESLERLRTSYIDLYALHRDDPSVEVGPIMEALNAHVEAGRIHAIGASNWSHERIQEANDYAKTHGLIGFTFSSPNLSLAKCRIPRWPGSISAGQEMIEWHQSNNLPLLSWSSQAGGFFSGRYTPDNLEDEEMVDVYYTADNWERYRRATELANSKGASAIQIALAYVLHQTYPTAALIGPERLPELQSSLQGMSIPLTENEIKWLDLVTDRI